MCLLARRLVILWFCCVTCRVTAHQRRSFRDSFATCCQQVNHPRKLFDCVSRDPAFQPVSVSSPLPVVGDQCPRDSVETSEHTSIHSGVGIDGNGDSGPNHRVLFTTYVSDNIVHYAAYNAFLNARLFHDPHHHHPLIIHTSNSTQAAVSDDQRWTKVPLLLEGMLSWGQGYDYLVFLDADLVVLDPTLDIDALLQTYPDADVLLSHDSLDYANTGVLIVRNNEWSKAFFRRWWSMKDTTANAFCDQHVLNHLSMLLNEEGEISHIQRLDQRILNSIWPPTENFLPTDKVLHMMGEHSFTRELVGKQLVTGMCAQWNKPSTLPSSHYLIVTTRKALLATKFDALTVLFYNVLHRVNEGFAAADCDELLSVVQQVCDATQRLATKQALCGTFVNKVNTLFTDKLTKSRIVSDPAVSLMFWDSRMSLQVYNLSLIHEVTPKLFLSERILNSIELLLTSNEFAASVTQLRNIQHIHCLRGTIFADVATTLAEHKRWRLVTKYLEISISEYASVLTKHEPESDQGSLAIDFQSTVLHYISAALLLSKSYWHQHKVDEAEEWVMIAKSNVDHLFDDFRGEMRVLVTLANDVLDFLSVVFTNSEHRHFLTHTNMQRRRYFAE
jgi:hypothetical protein